MASKKSTTPDDGPDVDQAQEAVQAATDAAEEKGFIGVQADDTPNDHYTVQGVTAGKPTPETTKDGGEVR